MKLGLVWHPKYITDFERFRGTEPEAYKTLTNQGGNVLIRLDTFEPLRQKLLDNRIVRESQFHEVQIDEEIVMERLRITHAPPYINKVEEALSPGGNGKARRLKKTKLPWEGEAGKDVWTMSKAIAACSIGAVARAVQDSRSRREAMYFNTQAGLHHAHYARGRVSCPVNDEAVAMDYAIDKLGVEKVFKFDGDVHNGDGTVEIMHGMRGYEDDFFCFDICQNKYPSRKRNGGFLEVVRAKLRKQLGNPFGDYEYYGLLEQELGPHLEENTYDLYFLNFSPDALGNDIKGNFGLTMDGYRQNMHFILDKIRETNPGAAIVLAGGSGYRNTLEELVDVKAEIVQMAADYANSH